MARNFSELPDSIQTVDLTEHNRERINYISKAYKKERQESKAPTFALTR